MVKYITVIAKMANTGVVSPISIIWEDGREFIIDKIIEQRPKASTKGGGKGTRYTVRIKDQEKYLFLNEYYWFIEID